MTKEEKKAEVGKLKEAVEADKMNKDAKLDYIISMLELGQLEHEPPPDTNG